MQLMMESPTSIVVAFWAMGMLLQSRLLLGKKLSKKDVVRILLCCVVSLSALLPTERNEVYSPHFHILMAFTLFAVIFAIDFREDILRHITELDVIVETLLCAYVLAENFQEPSSVLLATYGVLTGILVFLLLPLSFPSTKRVFLYLVHLGFIVTLGVLQFRYAWIAPFFVESSPIILSPATACIGGMAFLTMVVHVFYVFELIPIPGEHQTLKSKLSDIRESLQLMKKKTCTIQLRLQVSLLLMITVGLPLALNKVFQFLSAFTMINIVIVILPYILLVAERKMSGIFVKNAEYQFSQ